MDFSKKLTLILVAGVIIFSSCAHRKQVQTQTPEVAVPAPETTSVYAPAPPTRVETTRVLKEEKRDTTGFQGPIVVFEGDTGAEKDTIKVVLPDEVATLPETTTTPEKTAPVVTPETAGIPEKIMGYRVQIFATLKKEKAQYIADQARRILSKSVYVEYVPPFYKVRVGDFRNREDAEEYRDYLRANGYPDAFVVETEIKVR